MAEEVPKIACTLCGESTPIDHIGSHGECPVCFGIAQQKKQAEYSKQRTTWRDEHPPKPTSKD